MSRVLAPIGSLAADYSYARPPVARLKQLGYATVVRYISATTSTKNVSFNEVQAIRAAGLNLLLVWEMRATDALGGGPVGAASGAAALKVLRGLGYPEDVPVLVAVDQDITSKTVAVAIAYLAGFARAVAPYPIGVYGDADILLAYGNFSQLGWLPNAQAWSSVNKAAAITAGVVHALQHRVVAIDGKWSVDPSTVIAPMPCWGADVTLHQPPPSVPPSTTAMLPAKPISAALAAAT